jgi:hypothetical protein
MKALENEARASGVTEIGLSISLPSKRFYESLGYKVVRRIRMRPRSSCSETGSPAEETGLRVLTPFQASSVTREFVHQRRR